MDWELFDKMNKIKLVRERRGEKSDDRAIHITLPIPRETLMPEAGEELSEIKRFTQIDLLKSL